MTRNSKWMLALWVLIVTAAVSLAAAPQDSKKPANPPKKSGASEPLPDGTMKDTATTACTECHDSSIILQQRLSKAAWTKTVDKMIKWGADVAPKDHDPLIDYLATNFGPDKPPYEPPKTAATKANK